MTVDMTKEEYDDREFDELPPDPVPDKKASLTRVPSKPHPKVDKSPGPVALNAPPAPKAVPDFTPLKRDGDDLVMDNEKWEAKREREKLEKETEAIIVARMAPLEQLGLDAGRAAVQVKEMRRQLTSYQRNVVAYTQKLADAEALLADRIKQLNEAKL